jgi:hypothetical protein
MSRCAGNEQSCRTSWGRRRLSRSTGVVGGPRCRARPDGARGDDVVRRPLPTDPGGRCRPRRPPHAAEDDDRPAGGERAGSTGDDDDRSHRRPGDGTTWTREFFHRSDDRHPVEAQRERRCDDRERRRTGGRDRRKPGGGHDVTTRPADHDDLDQPGADDLDDRARRRDVRRLPGVPRRRVGDLPDRRRRDRFGHRHLDGRTDTFAYDHMHKPARITNWRIWHSNGTYR